VAHSSSAHGVLGLFLVVLGAGLILDIDASWWGGILMVVGAIGLGRSWQRPNGDGDRIG